MLICELGWIVDLAVLKKIFLKFERMYSMVMFADLAP